jgi:hypothetical protein
MLIGFIFVFKHDEHSIFLERSFFLGEDFLKDLLFFLIIFYISKILTSL